MNVDDEPDIELVKLFKAGNTAAFDAIVRRFQDRIYRLACVWLYDEQFAADAAQEVFVRSYKGLRAFRFRSTPFTWLYRTTRNVCHEFNRVRRADSLDDEPHDTSGIPERQVSDFETARHVRDCVSDLPERQREVVMLRIFEDLSVKETAAAMGCREGTVKALLHKATNNLRTKMQIAEFDETEIHDER